MKPMMLEQIKAERSRNAVFQRLCEKGIAEPEGIWEQLEARGMHVTPGVIYQAISNLNKPQETSDDDRRPRALPDDEKGVTWKDVEIVALVAEKAGGIRHLMRLLTRMRRVPR